MYSRCIECTVDVLKKINKKKRERKGEIFTGNSLVDCKCSKNNIIMITGTYVLLDR